jgi:hypothetical protein
MKASTPSRRRQALVWPRRTVVVSAVLTLIIDYILTAAFL